MYETREDAALARAAAAGDGDAFAAIYDRYAGRLHGLCRGMLSHRADAEDCLQDVFVLAATRLAGLREPERLRPWLFAIARHECLARIERRRRETLVDDFHDSTLPVADDELPDETTAAIAALLRDAAEGLSERDRLVLTLADAEGLDGNDLAAAIGLPRSTAYTVLARARTTAQACVQSLLVARTGRAACPDLDALLQRWDGHLDQLTRKRVARHIDACATCGERRRRITPALLLEQGGAFAAELVSYELPAGLRARTLEAVSARAPLAGIGAWPHGWPPGLVRRRRRGVLLALLAVGVAIVVAVGTAPLWHSRPAPALGPPAHAPSAIGSGSARPAVAPPPSSPATGRSLSPARKTAPPVISVPALPATSAPAVRPTHAVSTHSTRPTHRPSKRSPEASPTTGPTTVSPAPASSAPAISQAPTSSPPAPSSSPPIIQ